MFLRIENISAKQFLGKTMHMSLVDNKTPELWRSFMQSRSSIKHVSNSLLYSLQVYDSPEYFSKFNPATPFQKWALCEVDQLADIPDGMQTFELPAGQYAVFHHKGGPANAAAIFNYIFANWLPQSGYELDHRPHFEVLGEKYKNNAPDSEEEIWIPVKTKKVNA